MQYTNSEIDRLISERVHSERDRQLLRRRLIDGRTYDELSTEFFLSRRQVARIIARARSILTIEHPPDTAQKWHFRGIAGVPVFMYTGIRKGGGSDV